MNVPFRIAVPSAGAALFLVVFGVAGSAQAQVWRGSDVFGNASTFTNTAPDRWVEVVEGFGSRTEHRFDEQVSARDYIELLDSSRNCRVRLYDDRLELLNNLNRQWSPLYYGSWIGAGVPGLPSPAGLRVRFAAMHVWDDKEEGAWSRWKIKATVGNGSEVTVMSNVVGESGGNFEISYPPFEVTGSTVTVRVKVYERDGNDWKNLGPEQISINEPGTYQLEFDHPQQGKVTVYFTVEEI